jgi:hypothetical protein
MYGVIAKDSEGKYREVYDEPLTIEDARDLVNHLPESDEALIILECMVERAIELNNE